MWTWCKSTLLVLPYLHPIANSHSHKLCFWLRISSKVPVWFPLWFQVWMKTNESKCNSICHWLTNFNKYYPQFLQMWLKILYFDWDTQQHKFKSNKTLVNTFQHQCLHKTQRCLWKSPTLMDFLPHLQCVSATSINNIHPWPHEVLGSGQATIHNVE